MAAGNQDAEVGRVGRGDFVQDVGEFGGFVEFRQVCGVDFGNRRVFARHRPHFKFGVVAGEGGDVDGKARLVNVQHRQQGLNRVVAGREECAVLHLQVALVGGNHQDFVFAAAVRFAEFDAIKVGFRRGVLRERVGGREVCVVLGAVGDGLAGKFGHGFSWIGL